MASPFVRIVHKALRDASTVDVDQRGMIDGLNEMIAEIEAERDAYEHYVKKDEDGVDGTGRD